MQVIVCITWEITRDKNYLFTFIIFFFIKRKSTLIDTVRLINGRREPDKNDATLGAHLEKKKKNVEELKT